LDDSFLAFFERLIQAGLGPYPRPRWLIQGGPIDHRFGSENNRRIHDDKIRMTQRGSPSSLLQTSQRGSPANPSQPQAGSASQLTIRS